MLALSQPSQRFGGQQAPNHPGAAVPAAVPNRFTSSTTTWAPNRSVPIWRIRLDYAYSLAPCQWFCLLLLIWCLSMRKVLS